MNHSNLGDGTEAVTDQEKANVFNSHVSSILTNEDNSNIPLIIDVYTGSPITDVSISDNIVFNKLQNSGTSKSPGPDAGTNDFSKN